MMTLSTRTKERLAWGGLLGVCGLMYAFAWYALVLMR